MEENWNCNKFMQMIIHAVSHCQYHQLPKQMISQFLKTHGLFSIYFAILFSHILVPAKNWILLSTFKLSSCAFFNYEKTYKLKNDAIVVDNKFKINALLYRANTASGFNKPQETRKAMPLLFKIFFGGTEACDWLKQMHLSPGSQVFFHVNWGIYVLMHGDIARSIFLANVHLDEHSKSLLSKDLT